MACPFLSRHAQGGGVPTLAGVSAASPLWDHVSFFVDRASGAAAGMTAGCQLDPAFMAERHAALGETGYRITKKIEAICRVSATAGGLPTYNPSSTGLWRSDGTFDAERFRALAAEAVTSDAGVPCLVRNHLDALRHSSWWVLPPTLVVIAGCLPVPISFATITDGSLDELFALLADEQYRGEAACSVQRLREFYTDPSRTMQTREVALLRQRQAT